MTRARVCQRCGKIVVGECCKKVKQTSHSKGYDRKWRRFREQEFKRRVKAGTALCAGCGRAFGTESPHGDHIVPVSGPEDPLFFDSNNIQFLHAACHARKTEIDVKRGLTR